jgi:serine/threonine protein phosphatase PrpC
MTFDNETYRIERLHKSLDGGSRFIGRDSQEEPVELLLCTSEALIDERLERNARKPDVFPKLRIRTRNEDYFVAIFEMTPGTTAIGQLAKARSNRAVNDGSDLAERIVLPIAQLVERLHQDKLTLGVHDPAEIWMSESGEVSLLDLPLLDGAKTEPARRVVPGFSPPETYGRCGGMLDEQADVFFVGILLYHALVRVPVPSSVGLIDERLPPPGLFHPRVQADMSAVTRKATSLIRANRYPHMQGLSSALSKALQTERDRNAPLAEALRFEVATETHIGLLKQRYCAENQDSYFTSWDALASRGLFVVSDGVSVSEFGSGDQASEIVSDAARALWSSLDNRALFNADETLGAFDSTMDVSADLHLSPLPMNTAARNRLMADMLDAANATIGVRIQSSLPKSMIHPEGIMAATAVCCMIESNRLTHCSIGDSRIYLIRDRQLSTLTYEHNYANRLIGMGKDYNESSRAPNAAALVRCVGEFEFNSEHHLAPVPLKPDFGELYLLAGDVVILCSDGIPDYMASSEEQTENLIIDMIENAPSTAHLAYDLVVAANRGGGGDNLTCTVIKVT